MDDRQARLFFSALIELGSNVTPLLEEALRMLTIAVGENFMEKHAKLLATNWAREMENEKRTVRVDSSGNVYTGETTTATAPYGM